MNLFTLEHSKSAYCFDFAIYGIASVALAAFMMIVGPPEQRWEIAVYALGGLASWTFIEYALHRFVIHGLTPFSSWHAKHQRRPASLIYTPTILSAALIATLVFFLHWF